MYILAVLFVSAFSLVWTCCDKSEEEWKTGIDLLFVDLVRGYNTHNMTLINEINTEDIQIFSRGTLQPASGEVFDLGWHSLEVLHVRFTPGTFSVLQSLSRH